MPPSRQFKSILMFIHRWVALGLCILLVPIAVSGALLVWKDHLDALVNPHRHAVSGAELTSPSTYLAKAREALGSSAGAEPIAVRFPADAGRAVTVLARTAPREGMRPQLLTVYLDPPTARVLDIVEFRSSAFGFLHRFHENLAIPEYSGRSIVGWAGVGMLVLALSGIFLWWPRSGFLSGLRYRRSAATTYNLHHLLGFWISVPLALVSLTGIYLAFPQTARSTMAAIAPMNPQGQRPLFAGQVAADTRLTPETALAAALAVEPGARPAALFMAPIEGGGSGQGRREQAQAVEGTSPTALWRVQLARPNGGETVTLLVNDRTGAAQALPGSHGRRSRGPMDPLAARRQPGWCRLAGYRLLDRHLSRDFCRYRCHNVATAEAHEERAGRRDEGCATSCRMTLRGASKASTA
jgi:uncharacterized iron-regulated membrane protein